MSRIVEIAALLSLVVAGAALAARLAADPVPPQAPWQAGTTAALGRAGLVLRPDVDIRISGTEVARGFGRPACDGLLLVARLPGTAQSFGRLAPQIDLGGFAVSYLYRGTRHARLPWLARLRDRLYDGPGGTSGAHEVTVFAERGDCGLAEIAAASLRVWTQTNLATTNEDRNP